MSSETKKNAKKTTKKPTKTKEVTPHQEEPTTESLVSADQGARAEVPAHIEAAQAAQTTPASASDAQPRQVVIEFRGVSQATIAQVWEQLKSGGGAELDGAAYTLARSLADHPHWFGFFETIGLFEGEHVSYPGDVDPFLHVNLHLLIGLQILNDQPSEARAFYVTREAMGEAPHEVIHAMIEAFQRHLMWTAMNAGPEGQFDLNAYGETLRALAPLSRELMWARLGHDEPPALHPEASEVI